MSIACSYLLVNTQRHRRENVCKRRVAREIFDDIDEGVAKVTDDRAATPSELLVPRVSFGFTVAASALSLQCLNFQVFTPFPPPLSLSLPRCRENS